MTLSQLRQHLDLGPCPQQHHQQLTCFLHMLLLSSSLPHSAVDILQAPGSPALPTATSPTVNICTCLCLLQPFKAAMTTLQQLPLLWQHCHSDAANSYHVTSTPPTLLAPLHIVLITLCQFSISTWFPTHSNTNYHVAALSLHASTYLQSIQAELATLCQHLFPWPCIKQHSQQVPTWVRLRNNSLFRDENV